MSSLIVKARENLDKIEQAMLSISAEGSPIETKVANDFQELRSTITRLAKKLSALRHKVFQAALDQETEAITSFQTYVTEEYKLRGLRAIMFYGYEHFELSKQTPAFKYLQAQYLINLASSLGISQLQVWSDIINNEGYLIESMTDEDEASDEIPLSRD